MPNARLWGRTSLVVLLALGWLVCPSHLAAHPLGNFSISHYTAIHIARDVIELRYLIDMAEIPTFQELQETHIVPEQGHPSLPAYVARRAEALQRGLVLEVNGQQLALQAGASEVLFPAGAGGLPTLKLGVVYRAHLAAEMAARVNELRYRDGNFPGRVGWKEIVATGAEGVTLRHSSVPERDRSRQLANYPTDLLSSPPQDLEARVVFASQASSLAVSRVGDVASSSPSAGDDHGGSDSVSLAQGRKEPVRLQVTESSTPRSAFTELVTTPHMSVGIVMLATAVAAGLGAFHALEPGHGKTVVAAYLVGSRGTAWHAVMLGLIVTAAHTAGVYLLGVVTLLASRYVVPERLYPWLGALSGLIICVLGLSLFLRRYVGSGQQSHHHGHNHVPGHSSQHHGLHHDHHHYDHHHAYAHSSHTHPHHPVATVTPRDLLALGVTGGIVPCPAALVVLLSAISLGRIGFGLLLIVAFSMGLAAVLVLIGILMVYARRLMSHFHGDGRLLTRWLPLTSAAMITIFGVVIAVQALSAAGILQISL